MKLMHELEQPGQMKLGHLNGQPFDGEMGEVVGGPTGEASRSRRQPAIVAHKSVWRECGCGMRER
jgi:hypothetical protein